MCASTVTTGLLERLAVAGYQFCVFDPEGDYHGFEEAVTLGDPHNPPSPDEVLQLLRHMRTRPAKKGPTSTDLAALLRAADHVAHRRSLVFVVSDFISHPGWDEALARLARRHEVIAVRLIDPLERELPAVGLASLQDAESGEQIFVDTLDPKLRKRFAALVEQRDAALLDAFGRANVAAIELSTDDDLLDALLRFAELRRRQRRLAAGGALPAHLRPLQGGAA